MGCAGVKVTPLKSDDLTRAKGEEGLRYYMPLPYLLVMELPPTLGQTSALIPASDDGTDDSPFQMPPNGSVFTNTNSGLQAPSGPPAGEKAKPSSSGGNTTAGGNGSAKPGATNAPGETASSSQTTPPPISDVSFGGSTPQYVAKLIYLPDLSRPMAMAQSAGIGTAEMKPALQDGWMLTSLDATADSKVSESLQAIGSIVGSALGASSGTKAAGAAKSALTAPSGGPKKGALPQLPPDLSSYYGQTNGILRPGLYRFVYATNGVLTGIRAVAFFTGIGTVPPDPKTGAFPRPPSSH